MIDRINFSSADLNYSTVPDCVMPPDDPIYNNLAAREAARMDLPKIDSSNKGEIQRRQNIRPGTEEWFKLWFKSAR
jgi:hypothetical protein